MTRIASRYFTIFILAILLIACSSKKDIDPYQDWSAAAIFVEAESSLMSGRYERAIQAFESLDAQYPFGDYTEQAHLSLIYAYFRAKELPASLSAADRFVRLHPRSPHIDYAYYMRGIIKTNESLGAAARALPLDLTQRDPSGWREAYDYFADLLIRYPDSYYAPDARQRLIFLRNNLAQYELNVAEYYMSRKAYVAAANRATTVIEDFPQTPVVDQALALLVEAYDELDMPELAQQSYDVLLLNDPSLARTVDWRG